MKVRVTFECEVSPGTEEAIKRVIINNFYIRDVEIKEIKETDDGNN